jgi:uncharacterized Ntn-hydrolase superfamily protein
MVRCDAAQLRVRRLRADAPEEDPDLELPTPEVVAKDGHLLVVWNLSNLDGLNASTKQKLAFTGDPDVAHPVRLPSRRDQVLRLAEGQKVHGRASPLARLASPHAQHARTPNTDARPRGQCDEPIEDVLGEPIGSLVVHFHRAYDTDGLTYSIVARDKETGELGVAVESHYFQVGPVVPWALAGVGAVATQSMVNISFGPLGLEYMRNGYTAGQALKALLAADDQPESRQVALVDAAGNVAVHTGEKCIPAAGHRAGDGFTVQANLMEKDTVWDAMYEAFTATREPLAERMMAALEAAEAEGGDIRGKQSAGMLVVTGKPTGHSWEDRVIELRVEDAPDPIKELRRLLRVKRAYMTLNDSERLDQNGEKAAALEALRAATKMAPEMVEIQFWAGLTLAEAGHLDEGCELMMHAVRKDRRWIETLHRLVAVDRLKADLAERVETQLTAARL